MEMYQNRMRCQIDQGGISVPSRCTPQTPSTHGFLFWPNTQQSTSMWRDDLVQAGTESHPSCAFHQELKHHLTSSWEGWGSRPSPFSSLLLSPLEAACSEERRQMFLNYQFGIPRWKFLPFPNTPPNPGWLNAWKEVDPMRIPQVL